MPPSLSRPADLSAERVVRIGTAIEDSARRGGDAAGVPSGGGGGRPRRRRRRPRLAAKGIDERAELRLLFVHLPDFGVLRRRDLPRDFRVRALLADGLVASGELDRGKLTLAIVARGDRAEIQAEERNHEEHAD